MSSLLAGGEVAGSVPGLEPTRNMVAAMENRSRVLGELADLVLDELVKARPESSKGVKDALRLIDSRGRALAKLAGEISGSASGGKPPPVKDLFAFLELFGDLENATIGALAVLNDRDVINDVKSGMSHTFNENVANLLKNIEKLFSARFEKDAEEVVEAMRDRSAPVEKSFEAYMKTSKGRYPTILISEILEAAGRDGKDVRRFVAEAQNSIFRTERRTGPGGLHPVQHFGFTFGMHDAERLGDTDGYRRMISHLPQSSKAVRYRFRQLLDPTDSFPVGSGLNHRVIERMRTVTEEPVGREKPTAGKRGKLPLARSIDGGNTFYRVESVLPLDAVDNGVSPVVDSYNGVLSDIVASEGGHNVRLLDDFEVGRESYEKYLAISEETMLSALKASLGSSIPTDSEDATVERYKAEVFGAMKKMVVARMDDIAVKLLSSEAGSRAGVGRGVIEEFKLSVFSQILQISEIIALRLIQSDASLSFENRLTSVLRGKSNTVEKMVSLRPQISLKMFYLMR